jgi:UDP-N-acetyl-D-mannosaminuronate dehydrogenase
MNKVLVVGNKGKVGSSLYELLCGVEDFQVWGIDKNELEVVKEVKKVDIMHICYGCKDEEKFIETTVNYIKKFDPSLIIINSTVVPTATETIFQKTGKMIVHSPIRGMHPYFKHDLLHYIKFIGAVNKKASEQAKQHFEKLGMKTYICDSPKETEFAKLFATSYYALMIAAFQEMYRICKEHDVNYNQVVDFIKTEEDKPILHAGYIGGECLIPNIYLLLKKADSKILHAILESNERWKPTVKEKQIRGTIRKDSWRFDTS